MHRLDLRGISLVAATFAMGVGCDSNPGATDEQVDAGQLADGATPRLDGGGGGDAGPGVPPDPPTNPNSFPWGEARPAAPATALPAADPLYLRSYEVMGDRATFRLFPVEGARDYRIYPLPSDGQVTMDGDTLHVEDAVYRCAGSRFPWWIASDGDPTEARHPFAVTTTVRGEVDSFDRSSSDPVLGYVGMFPADGTEPLYAVGSPHEGADHDGEALRTPETRVKRYVVGATARQRFLDAGWRDDGLVGYVPATASGATQTAHVAARSLDPAEHPGSILYYTDAAEHGAREGEPEFEVFREPGAGRAALGRVSFRMFGDLHDELVVGAERLDQVKNLGTIPHLAVQWPNVTDGQTFVIEALDRLCPFQGNALPDDGEQVGELIGSARALGALAAADAHGEVFLNGQGDAGDRPRVLARTFMTVTPGTDDTDWAWEMRFDGSSFPWAGSPRTTPSWESHIWTFEGGTVHFALCDAGRYGVQDGELWVSLMDVGSGVNGKFRFTPEVTVDMTDTQFAHGTMEVDFFSSDRRYPQLFFTDRRVPTPIQDLAGDAQNLELGAGILVQAFNGSPTHLEVQLCDRRPWDVNNQCPSVDLETPDDGRWPTPRPVSASALSFHRSRLDAYATTDRVYVFLDGRAYGCANIPEVFSYEPGPSHVTFGTVLYHSGIDLDTQAGNGSMVFPFHREHQRIMSQRRFDNLAVRSTNELPTWPDTITCRDF
jgi:hypothetical protein